MNIKIGDEYWFNGVFSKYKVKVVKIMKSKYELVIGYRTGFPFYSYSECSGESFKNRTLEEVNEAEI